MYIDESRGVTVSLHNEGRKSGEKVDEVNMRENWPNFLSVYNYSL
jgi:hypothetical protein